MRSWVLNIRHSRKMTLKTPWTALLTADKKRSYNENILHRTNGQRSCFQLYYINFFLLEKYVHPLAYFEKSGKFWPYAYDQWERWLTPTLLNVTFLSAKTTWKIFKSWIISFCSRLRTSLQNKIFDAESQACAMRCSWKKKLEAIMVVVVHILYAVLHQHILLGNQNAFDKIKSHSLVLRKIHLTSWTCSSILDRREILPYNLRSHFAYFRCRLCCTASFYI